MKFYMKINLNRKLYKQFNKIIYIVYMIQNFNNILQVIIRK